MAGRNFREAVEKIGHRAGGSLRTRTMGSVAALLRQWSTGDRQQRGGTIVARCRSGKKSCTGRNYAQFHGLDSQDSKYAGGARTKLCIPGLHIIYKLDRK